MMKITAFHGSPRKGGNSDILLGETIRGIDPAEHDTTVFRLNEMNIRPCQNCGGCEETGSCVIDDDMGVIYKAILEADRIIISSPIFFLALPAQIKIMIDRCQSLWCRKYLLKQNIPAGPYGRKGLLLLVGGMTKETGVQCSETSARAFFRSVGVPEHETLSFLGIDEKGAITGHSTALQDAFLKGRKLVATT
jgi:multimeric flavodoxin WrbA